MENILFSNLLRGVKRPLSNYDLMNIVKNESNLITYKNLKYFNKIDDILFKNACIILFENRSNIGHWICLIKRKNKNGDIIIEYFDSYGMKPDEGIKNLDKYFRKKNGIDKPHLTYLLNKCPYEVHYNHHKLQSKDFKVNTCGRWCAARIILKNLETNDFAELFYGSNLSPDILVTYLTEFLF